jgi:hypothetical protein
MKHKCENGIWTSKVVPHGGASTALYFRLPSEIIRAHGLRPGLNLVVEDGGREWEGKAVKHGPGLRCLYLRIPPEVAAAFGYVAGQVREIRAVGVPYRLKKAARASEPEDAAA